MLEESYLEVPFVSINGLMLQYDSGIEIICTDDELIDFTLGVDGGYTLGIDEGTGYFDGSNEVILRFHCLVNHLYEIQELH